MIRLLIIASAIVLASPALAQQQAANPQEQIERTIGSLFVTNTNLSAQLQAAQARVTSLTDDLAKAQARIKELEPKQEGR